MTAAVSRPSDLSGTNIKEPPLLERLRRAALERGAPGTTADHLVSWARAFILFHDKRHPREMGLSEATHYLEHVVMSAPEPLPALAQARSALMLLYDGVLGMCLGELPQPRPPRVLDQLRLVLRVRHYSRRTEDCYVNWARRFILYHRKRHPRTMGAGEVEQFLTHLAVEERISASSQNQALNQSAVGGRQSAVGSRQSAVGSRRSGVGGRESAVGSRQSAGGSRRSAVGSG